jgi:hypothetical protein
MSGKCRCDYETVDPKAVGKALLTIANNAPEELTKLRNSKMFTSTEYYKAMGVVRG